MNTNDESLKHVGVMGMHWGHRSGGSSKSGGGVNGVQRLLGKQAKIDRMALQKKNNVGIIPRFFGMTKNFSIKPKGMSDEDFNKEYATEMHSAVAKYVKNMPSMKKQSADSGVKSSAKKGLTIVANLLGRQAKIDRMALQKKNHVGLVPRLFGMTENIRVGKEKGQSNAAFDKEYTKETRK